MGSNPLSAVSKTRPLRRRLGQEYRWPVQCPPRSRPGHRRRRGQFSHARLEGGRQRRRLGPEFLRPMRCSARPQRCHFRGRRIQPQRRAQGGRHRRRLGQFLVRHRAGGPCRCDRNFRQGIPDRRPPGKRASRRLGIEFQWSHHGSRRCRRLRPCRRRIRQRPRAQPVRHDRRLGYNHRAWYPAPQVALTSPPSPPVRISASDSPRTAASKPGDPMPSVPLDVPAGLDSVIGISAGYFFSLATRADGRLFAWGYNTYQQTAVPAGLGPVQMAAAGNYHVVALVGSSPPEHFLTASVPAVVGLPVSRQLAYSGTADRFNAWFLPPGLSFDTQTGSITGVPQQKGSFNIRVTAEKGFSRITKIISIDCENPRRFEEWSAVHFPGTAAAPLADSDGDGLSDFLEYALHRNPAGHDPDPPATLTTVQARWREFPRAPLRTLQGRHRHPSRRSKIQRSRQLDRHHRDRFHHRPRRHGNRHRPRHASHVCGAARLHAPQGGNHHPVAVNTALIVRKKYLSQRKASRSGGLRSAGVHEVAMRRGKTLFIGFPWARRFGDRRSLFLQCDSCSLDNGTNVRQKI